MDDLRAAVRTYFDEPAYRRAPGDLYARISAEAPVLRIGGFWLVSGYDEIQQICRASDASVYPVVGGSPLALAEAPTLAAAMSLMLPMRDGPAHRRLRRLAAGAFSPRRLAATAAEVEEVVDELLDPLFARGSFDLVADVARPLPVLLSCALLDIPPADQPAVAAAAIALADETVSFGQPSASVARAEATTRDLLVYIADLCAGRRRHPGDDLVSDLVRAADEGALSEDELSAFVLMLFLNGLGTLTSALSVGTLELLGRPEWLAAVRQDEALAPAVFEECTRLASPVRFVARALLGDVAVGPHLLAEKSLVVLWLAAANRDPRRFPCPSDIDPHRAGPRHLAFGSGTHFCLGSTLAVAASAAVFRRLARQGDALQALVDGTTACWHRSLAFNALEALPVTCLPQRLTAVGGR